MGLPMLNAAQILCADPMIVQTMYLEKYPAAEGKGTALHQDSHYLPNDPNTLMTCWLAMSDTDGENGGLCVVPRSHTRGLSATHKATNAKDHQVWESEHLMRDRRAFATHFVARGTWVERCDVQELFPAT